MTLTSQRTAAELVAEKLAQNPTQFRRLLYVAGSLISETARYRHEGMRLTHDAESIHTAFLKAHEREWQAWLALPLQRQHEDLIASATGSDRRQFAREFARYDPWTKLAPPSAPQHERDLFAADLRTLLSTLRKP